MAEAKKKDFNDTIWERTDEFCKRWEVRYESLASGMAEEKELLRVSEPLTEGVVPGPEKGAGWDKESELKFRPNFLTGGSEVVEEKENEYWEFYRQWIANGKPVSEGDRDERTAEEKWLFEFLVPNMSLADMGDRRKHFLPFYRLCKQEGVEPPSRKELDQAGINIWDIIKADRIFVEGNSIFYSIGQKITHFVWGTKNETPGPEVQQLIQDYNVILRQEESQKDIHERIDNQARLWAESTPEDVQRQREVNEAVSTVLGWIEGNEKSEQEASEEQLTEWWKRSAESIVNTIDKIRLEASKKHVPDPPTKQEVNEDIVFYPSPPAPQQYCYRRSGPIDPPALPDQIDPPTDLLTKVLAPYECPKCSRTWLYYKRCQICNVELGKSLEEQKDEDLPLL